MTFRIMSMMAPSMLILCLGKVLHFYQNFEQFYFCYSGPGVNEPDLSEEQCVNSPRVPPDSKLSDGLD